MEVVIRTDFSSLGTANLVSDTPSITEVLNGNLFSLEV